MVDHMDLLDIDGVASLCGVRRGSVRQWLYRRQMPEPVARFGGSPVWDRVEVEGWWVVRSERYAYLPKGAD